MATDLISKGYSDSDEANIIVDLKQLFPFIENGYEMAKNLENYNNKAYYNIDIPFCEWLEILFFEYQQRLNKNIEDWVAAHDIKPKFEQHTKLLTLEKLSATIPKGSVVYVNGINKKLGIYFIDLIPKLLFGTNIKYEDAEKNCEVVII